jgi:hypothetical protein
MDTAAACSLPKGNPCISGVQVSARAFTIPTATPEPDGTLEWNATTLVQVLLGADAGTPEVSRLQD